MGGLRAIPLRVVAYATCALGVAVACYSPTEVQIDVSTDIRCTSLETGVFVNGEPDAVGTAYDCPGGGDPGGGTSVGRFFVDPGGARDAEIDVVIALSDQPDMYNPARCVAEAHTGGDPEVRKHCILARRSFRFDEHRTTYVGVRLYTACLGEPCDDPQTTCVANADGTHACPDKHVQPADDPGSEYAQGGSPPFPAADGGGDGGDAGDGGVDAGLPCAADRGGVLAMLSASQVPVAGAKLMLDTETSSLLWVGVSGEAFRMPTDGSAAPAAFYMMPSKLATYVFARAGFAFLLAGGDLVVVDLRTPMLFAPVALGTTKGVAIEATTSSIYVAAATDGVRQVSRDGGATASSYENTVGSHAVAANDTVVYWSTDFEVNATDPSSSVTNRAGPFPQAGVTELVMARPSSQVYYMRTDGAGTHVGRIGGTEGSSNATHIAVFSEIDGGDTFYGIEKGPPAIVRYSPGTPARLPLTLDNPTGLAVDANCVYYVEHTTGASTMRAAPRF